MCRFNSPLAPLDDTRIVCSEENIDETKVRQSRVTEEQHGNTLECVKKKVSIVYKRNSCEVDIGSYSTVTLKLLKSNMKI